MIATLPMLLAAPEETSLRFKALPPMWILIMLILPAVLLFVWWIYAREGDTAPRGAKRILAGLRIAAILLVILLLFQPYAETSVKKLVKSHVVILVDTSASMEFKDAWSDTGRAAALQAAAGLAAEAPSSLSRLELAKRALGNQDRQLLERLAEQFHIHVYSFHSGAELVASAGEGEIDETGVDTLRTGLRGLAGTGAVTFLGSALGEVLDEFRLRDEPLAGVVVVTDGRQTGGAVGAVEAARKATSARSPVPLYLVGVGDPDRPRNVHVSNLRAKEVVLRGDAVSFEFRVTHKGYAGEVATVEMARLDPEGNPEEDLDLEGADIVLGEEDDEQTVRVSRRFDRAGSFTLRVGIPVQPGEKIEADNFLVHHLRVVDKKIKVLYAEGYPRWEYRYLKNALIRDTETMLVHIINLAADPEGVVQPFSPSPGWKPRQRFPTTREEIFEYDVIIFGDVDWKQLGRTEVQSKEVLDHIGDFVAEGGGFIMVAGPYNSPGSYRSTNLRHILPVVTSTEEGEWSTQDPTRSFNLVLTPEGEAHPIMQLDEDRQVSKQIWQGDKFSAQFWYFPVERAKPTATVLARHPGDFSDTRNKYGPHVIMATMRYGSGRTLYVGVDELWRLRWSFGDRYHYRFYGEAIRHLATFRLLGGNKRFKIFTDRNTYYVGDAIQISAEVFDSDFNPATADQQDLVIRTPDGDERTITLLLDRSDPGNYTAELTVHREGTYLLTAEAPDGEEERPEKLFKVEYSTAEMRNPLIDTETLLAMSREADGRLLDLGSVGELPDLIPAQSVYITSEVRSKDLWDNIWVILALTAILAGEWMLRKRYRLV